VSTLDFHITTLLPAPPYADSICVQYRPSRARPLKSLSETESPNHSPLSNVSTSLGKKRGLPVGMTTVKRDLSSRSQQTVPVLVQVVLLSFCSIRFNPCFRRSLFCPPLHFYVPSRASGEVGKKSSLCARPPFPEPFRAHPDIQLIYSLHFIVDPWSS